MKYSITFLFVLIAQLAFCQSDEPDCRDHPLIGRMPNTYITLCSTGEDAVEMQMSASVSDMKSGKRFYARYSFAAVNQSKPPTFGQIVANLEANIIKNGGKKIFSSDSLGSATLLIPGKPKDTWISINDLADGNYELVTVEVNSVKKVTPLSMLDDLSVKGKSILYMKFEDKKPQISSESTGMIDIIVDLLQTESELMVSIEAHSNDFAQAAANQQLSDERALTVYEAIVAKGVDKNRMKYKGWGGTKPVTDNKSEEGKSKNNRIEIIKL